MAPDRQSRVHSIEYWSGYDQGRRNAVNGVLYSDHPQWIKAYWEGYADGFNRGKQSPNSSVEIHVEMLYDPS